MANDEAAIEAEIQAKGLNAPRLSPAHIDDQIVAEEFHVFSNGRTTVCMLTVKNGFAVVGESSAVHADNFDPALGRKIARDNARAKIWRLEGYLLRSRLATVNSTRMLPEGGGAMKAVS